VILLSENRLVSPVHAIACRALLQDLCVTKKIGNEPEQISFSEEDRRLYFDCNYFYGMLEG
jgi:hypothetical protein